MKTDREKRYPRTISDRTVAPLPSGMAPQRAPLTGRFVRLEPLDPAAHADELYDASHRDAEARKIWDFLPDGPWPDQPQFERWLRESAGLVERVVLTIRSAETGKACGMAQYLDVQPNSGVIEIGYIWFAPAVQRTRATTEALFLLLAHAIDDLGYRRMQWRCNSRNERSRAAARRLGFRFEGIFYNHMIVKGRNRDTAWYSILDHEWPEVRDNITAWLADANFDDQGRAKTSLGEMMRQRAVPAGE